MSWPLLRREGTINEGKGRLKSWTLCDGLGEGVKG